MRFIAQKALCCLVSILELYIKQSSLKRSSVTAKEPALKQRPEKPPGCTKHIEIKVNVTFHVYIVPLITKKPKKLMHLLTVHWNNLKALLHEYDAILRHYKQMSIIPL